MQLENALYCCPLENQEIHAEMWHDERWNASELNSIKNI